MAAISCSTLTVLPRDILLRICGLLQTDLYGWRKPQRQPSLAALAVTCTTLSEPALDVLWATLGSLVPLVAYTLPRDLCAIVPLPEKIKCHSYLVEYQVVFRREPVAADFCRLSAYANRVTTLKTEDRSDAQLFSNYEIPFDVLARLMHYGPQPLFPNLRSLHYSEIYWYNRYEPGVAGRGPLYRSEPLFGPRLKEVTIKYGDWPSDETRPTEVVRSLSYRSPLVKSITMYQPGLCHPNHSSSRPARLVGPTIGTFVHLVKLDLRTLFTSPTAFLALGSLTKLQELALCVDPKEYHCGALPHGRHCSLFPALEDLSLFRVPLEWCVAFIDIISSPSLWSVAINYQESDPEALPGMLLEALCASIGSHPSFDNIEKINLTIGRSSRESPQVYRSPHISPLLSLPALRKLYITGHCLVVVDDAFLDAVTWSWPHIESLDLSWPNDVGRTGTVPGELGFPEATLAGVIPLARYCPHLTSLDIPVDIRDVPRLDERRPPVPLWPSYEESPLQSFCPTGSTFRADDAPALAMFLSVMFPKLESFGFPWQDTSTSDQVLVLHRRFLGIRWEERRWMLANGRCFREPERDRYVLEEGYEAEVSHVSSSSNAHW